MKGEFYYNLANVKAWKNRVATCHSNINDCAKKFSSIVDNLFNSKIWDGSAAKSNYEKFREIHSSLIKFLIKFASNYTRAMDVVDSYLSDINGTQKDNTPLDDNTSEMGDKSFNTEVVTYDTATIKNVITDLKQAFETLKSAQESLLSEIEKLSDSSAEVWYGEAASLVFTNLKNLYDNNIDNITDGLSIWITNIESIVVSIDAMDGNGA